MSIRIYRACGSSPLARGTLRWHPARRPGCRFIPAGAGNTRRGAERGFQWAVHPRWRGEHQVGRLMVELERGSSPLARGTPALSTRCNSAWRFIPAGAGNTLPPGHQPRRTPVHPRWRGEHHHPVTGKQFESGSSPLARGTRGQDGLADVHGRFIPAGAGNTWPGGAVMGHPMVHPRWRGEHRSSIVSGSSIGGSSPLARGTLERGAAALVDQRFIPAGAGNTASLSLVAGCATVHPRWRGEHCRRTTPTAWRYGSSPLARGTRRVATAPTTR